MHHHRCPPAYLLPGSAPWFPDPSRFDGEGLVAIGGDVTPARLLHAYRHGIFPWYSEGILPMWWSPDPRATLEPESLHVSRKLARTLRRGGFRLTWNCCFSRVMTECGRFRPEGTWVIPEMLEAYEQLNGLGFAHSLEVWCDDELAGGIYGVQIGGLFAAESMFHRRMGMSKVAFVALARSLFDAGIELFDAQFATPHLVSLGVSEVARSDYLRRVHSVCDRRVDLSGLRVSTDS